MFKKVSVVLLATNQQACSNQLIIAPNNPKENRLLQILSTFNGMAQRFIDEGKSIPQNLYFLSDDKVEEGDWCIGNNKIYALSPDQFFVAQCTSVVNGRKSLK